MILQKRKLLENYKRIKKIDCILIKIQLVPKVKITP